MNDVWLLLLPMALSVVGGLGLFMLGMKYMSEGLQAITGDSLRRMISLVTNNRIMAMATGMVVTMMAQSSTVSTIIMLGLVNGGLMRLHQAVGFIMGANIGTTTTGWILVLQVGTYGLPLLGVAAFVYLFSRSDRPRFIAMSIMGIGMVFFGLELMKDGLAPMRDIPEFVDAFAWFEADSYWGVIRAVFVGCLVTLIVQSSSATLGMTIGLAATGVIPFSTAAALVIGENIGTTFTIVIASIGGTTDAKRSALAHVLFNVIGAAWITSIFFLYIRVISAIIQSVHGADPLTVTMGDFATEQEFAAVMTAGIALTHTLFSVANTAIFLPFLNPYVRLLKRLIPDPTEKEVGRLRRLDARMVSAPVLGMEQSRGEVIQMGQNVIKMMDWTRQVGIAGSTDKNLVKRIFRREEVLDNMHEEIITFLTDVLDATMPQHIAEEGQQQLRIAHEYESLGDRLAAILKGFLKLRDRNLDIPPDQLDALAALHDDVADFLRRVVEAFEARTAMTDEDAQAASAHITRTVKRLRAEHLERMTTETIDPILSLTYTTLLTDYRRVRAHIINLHEAEAGTVEAETV